MAYDEHMRASLRQADIDWLNNHTITLEQDGAVATGGHRYWAVLDGHSCHQPPCEYVEFKREDAAAVPPVTAKAWVARIFDANVLTELTNATADSGIDKVFVSMGTANAAPGGPPTLVYFDPGA